MSYYKGKYKQEQEWEDFDVAETLSHIVENQLIIKKVDFKRNNRITGAFTNPFVTYRVNKKYKDIVNDIVNEVELKNRETASTHENNQGIKIRVFDFILTFTTSAMLIILNILLINFAIQKYKGEEIWIVVIVVLLLTVLTLYSVCRSFATSMKTRATSTKNPNKPVRYIGRTDTAGVWRAGQNIIDFGSVTLCSYSVKFQGNFL